MKRTCLHCVVTRALRAMSPALQARGLELRVGPFEPILLPARAGALYRGLRALLADAAAQGGPGRIKLAVLNLPGKSHIEVTAALGARVLSCAFPRHVPATLPGGFAEHADPSR